MPASASPPIISAWSPGKPCLRPKKVRFSEAIGSPQVLGEYPVDGSEHSCSDPSKPCGSAREVIMLSAKRVTGGRRQALLGLAWAVSCSSPDVATVEFA